MTKKTDDGMVEIVCTCDRIVLPAGDFLVRDQKAKVPAQDAENYIASEWAERV